MNPTELNVSEPTGVATFTVALAAAPTAPVTIHLTASNGECTVPVTAVLDDGNWQSGVSVTVTAIDDAVDDGAQPCAIQTVATSADPTYNGMPVDDVAVTVADDDVAAIAVSKLASVATANVGDAVVYTFRLTNTGTVNLGGVSAQDNRLGPLALTATSLAPGSVAISMVTYTVQAADLPGPLVNTVTATGLSTGGKPVQAQASAAVSLVDGSSRLDQDGRHPGDCTRMHGEHRRMGAGRHHGRLLFQRGKYGRRHLTAAVLERQPPGCVAAASGHNPGAGGEPPRDGDG